MNKKYHICISLFVLILCTTSHSVELPHIFSNHMVLQRNADIPVWGIAESAEEITIEFSNQKKQTLADAWGRWRIYLDSIQAGGPYAMTIKGRKKTIIIRDILVGDVWLCSGQSNMDWPVKNSLNHNMEISTANYPKIRLCKVQKQLSDKPKSDAEVSWIECSPETISNFSAVGYFFGRKLYQDLNVPVGLIHCAWGGSTVEAWTSRKAIGDMQFSPKLLNAI